MGTMQVCIFDVRRGQSLMVEGYNIPCGFHVECLGPNEDI